MPRDSYRKHALPMTMAIACALPNHSASSDIMCVHMTSVTDREVCLGKSMFSFSISG